MNILQRMLALDEWEAGKQAHENNKPDCPYPWTDDKHWFKRRQWVCGYASMIPKSQTQHSASAPSTGTKVVILGGLGLFLWGCLATLVGPLTAIPVLGVLVLLAMCGW